MGVDKGVEAAHNGNAIVSTKFVLLGPIVCDREDIFDS
jgi:hypothetical protein